MCFIRKFKKKIDTLQKSVDDLKKTIETNELVRLREIQKKYVEKNTDLSNIKFNVKRAVYSEENRTVLIEYSINPIVIKIDAEGKPELNKTFRSINMLDLISIEDMNKINNIFKKIKPLS